MRVLSSTSSEYLSLKSNDYATKQLIFVRQIFVVFLSFSTSNHNYWHAACIVFSLYIFHFLHQTTTFASSFSSVSCCISFIFYIKPQPDGAADVHLLVVYLSFSTSNHNLPVSQLPRCLLYIFHFLHQTTTDQLASIVKSSCISFIFYIKPQHRHIYHFVLIVVYLSFSTSNHNYSA